MTNLALRFPGLTAEEFAPWVAPGTDAAAAATTWRDGLATWGLESFYPVARVTTDWRSSDDTKADLRHTEELECIVVGLGERIDPGELLAVDYDDRDLRDAGPEPRRPRSGPSSSAGPARSARRSTGSRPGLRAGGESRRREAARARFRRRRPAQLVPRWPPLGPVGRLEGEGCVVAAQFAS